MDTLIREDHFITPMPEEYEVTCWGCGTRLLLPSYSPVYKCGWCGALTNQTPRLHGCGCRWRHLRDRCLVSILLLFMFCVISGGVWAGYPYIFSVSFSFGFLHSIITIILSVSTVSSFSLAAFRSAGAPPSITWGTYSLVDRHGLDNYTFCLYCSKPKSPRTHHCRTCGMCVLDMDHHCPFIGNCVGAANHRSFIIFLVSAIISTTYVSIMTVYTGLHLWPPLTYGSLGRFNGLGPDTALRVLKKIVLAFLKSTVLISPRGVVLVYLFIASFSVLIGLSILLWQQLSYIYEGKTYLSHLSSQEENRVRERGCQNIYRFFGWPYSASRLFSIFSTTKKPHRK